MLINPTRDALPSLGFCCVFVVLYNYPVFLHGGLTDGSGLLPKDTEVCLPDRYHVYLIAKFLIPLTCEDVATLGTSS